MHLLKHKDQKSKPLVPIISVFAVPGVRKMRGRRYSAAGEDIGPCGPPKPVPDVSAQKAVREAFEAAKKKPEPQEGGALDLNQFHPLRGRILVVRGPMLKERGGIALPEDKWYFEKWYYVVAVGDGVERCAVGDRVVFQAKHKPKPIQIGVGKFFASRDAVVIATVEYPKSD